MILLVIFNQGPTKNKPLLLIYYIPLHFIYNGARLASLFPYFIIIRIENRSGAPKKLYFIYNKYDINHTVHLFFSKKDIRFYHNFV